MRVTNILSSSWISPSSLARTTGGSALQFFLFPFKDIFHIRRKIRNLDLDCMKSGHPVLFLLLFAFISLSSLKGHLGQGQTKMIGDTCAAHQNSA